MIPQVRYERIGKFIFGACMHGGTIVDVHHWMADELGVVHSKEGDEAAIESLQAGYFAKFVSDEEFSESHQRFMKMMEQRGA